MDSSRQQGEQEQPIVALHKPLMSKINATEARQFFGNMIKRAYTGAWRDVPPELEPISKWFMAALRSRMS
jgi:hypothetical protein